MAGVESASAPPLAPAPPPSTAAPAPPPSTAAPASALRAEDLVVVAAAFVVGVFGFAWLSSAANAAFIAAEWGYGRGSIQVAFAKDIALAASVLLGIFLHALLLVILTLFWREESRRTETREVIGAHGGGTAAQQPARGQENRIPCGVVVSLVALLMIIVLAVLMQVTSWWAKGARDVGAGYLLVDTVFFLCSVIFCLVTAPLLIIRLVVSSRPGRRQTAGSN